jgi:hypothetical protein
VVGRVDVDGDHAVDRVRVEGQRVAHDERAGIDDEHVDGAARSDGCGERLAVGAVGADRLRAGFHCQRLRRILRTGISKGDIAAPFREAPDHRRPDAAAAAEHEHILSGELSHDGLLAVI